MYKIKSLSGQQKFKDKMSDSQINTLNEELGDLDELEQTSENSGSQETLTRTRTNALPIDNPPSKTCIIM